MHWFVSRDGKGKIRVVEMSAGWNEEQHAFGIYRTTYQYKGKRTEQPTIYVSVGKASRTLREQLELEYKSNMKKYLDKGYKQLEKLSERILSQIYGQDLAVRNVVEAATTGQRAIS